MLGSLILYLKGMRIMMFQLSGFYCMAVRALGSKGVSSLGLTFTDSGLRGLYVYLNLQNLPFCRVPIEFHIRVYNKNLQKSRVW